MTSWQSGKNRLIVGLQLFWQYALWGWFALVTVLLLAGSETARGLAGVGIGLIVVATVTIVAGLAWQFRKAGHQRGVWLCGILLLILALSVGIRFITI